MSVHQPSSAMILVVRARGEEERMPQARRNPLWLQRLDLERDSSLAVLPRDLASWLLARADTGRSVSILSLVAEHQHK
jgi:hypothetical protein